jgi:hypothetical protein
MTEQEALTAPTALTQRQGGFDMETVFDFVADELEKRTDLEKLEARGTIRLALKAAGFNPREVSPEQMAVVLEQVMPGELRPRGIDDPDSLCSDLAIAVKSFQPVGGDTSAASPEDVFRRLARS